MSNGMFRAVLTGIAVAICAYAIEEPRRELRIKILEGNDVINYLNQRTGQEPLVQVEDENHKPVAGALVLFELPDKGPGGVFANGARTLSVRTDTLGRATANGLRANGAQGQFHISVSAQYQNLSAQADIRQINQKPIVSQKPVKERSTQIGHGKTIAILAAVAGAAAVGVVIATSHKNTPNRPGPTPPVTPPSGTVVIPGTISVGAP